MTTSRRVVRYRDVLAIGEFRALWVALGQSAVGDQLARVALSVLVFSRTQSPALTALVYALTFVPTVVGGVLLSGLADRLPRRNLLAVIDLSRACLVGAMALPRLPLWTLFVLLFGTVIVSAPFSAAVGASLLDILPDDESYVMGAALRSLTFQLAQVLGFAVGGVVVAAIGSRGALLADAVTYLVSATVIAQWVRWRAPARMNGTPIAGGLGNVLDALRVVAGAPLLRRLLGLGALSGLLIVPEGLAAPYAAAAGAGPMTVGILLTGLPAGTAIGALVLARWLPAERRVAAIGIMAATAGLPLVVLFVQPSIPATVGLLLLVGAGSAYQVLASTVFVRAVPGQFRGAALGVAGSLVVASQGLGVLAFGMVADLTSAAHAAGIAGVTATAVGILLATGLRNVVLGSAAAGATAPVSG